MADPVVTATPKDVWTKVATNVTSGMVHILNTDPDIYLSTYRDTANPAPANPATDGEAIPFNPALQISAGAGIDVYIMTRGEDGSVRVDL